MPKKKYSINWENDEPVSFEVNGILYESIDQVPDEADREKLAGMLDAASDQEFDKEFDRELAAHKKSSVNAEKLILGIFSGVAALMLMIAAISAFRAVSRLSREASAAGRVVEVVVERAYINEQDRIVRDFYYPVIEFTAGDGRRRSVQVSEGSDYAYYEAGDEVTVRYDPEHPLDARIKSAGGDALMWILPGITGLLGLGFLGAVMVVRRFMPPTETDELA